MFDKEEMKEVDSWLQKIRETRKEIGETKFGDVADYCVARREETIGLFIEMSTFLEDNIDVFYNPCWEWVPSNICRNAMMNYNNPILGYGKTDMDYIHLWIPKGIKFLLRLSEKRVLWITHECNISNTNSDMEPWYYNFFCFWDNGKYPTQGYEKYLKDTPAMECYFPNFPEGPKSYLELKKKVDEDWENAKVCRECLKKAIVTIMDCDKELLSKIKNMKTDIRLARKDEGF